MWFCALNPDPRLSAGGCNIPEQEYEAKRPASARDKRLRSHLKQWVRRLQCADKAQERLPTSAATRGRKRPPGEVEWVQCSAPNCGKWRALGRAMEGRSIVERHREWFCVLNTWDEALASCAAPQELPVGRRSSSAYDDGRGGGGGVSKRWAR